MKVELQRGLSLDIPLYYDILEGKASLAFTICENADGSATSTITAGEILAWLKGYGNQQFPGSGRTFLILHKKFQDVQYISFLYSAQAAAGAYVDIQISWMPVGITRQIMGARGAASETLPMTVGLSEEEAREKELRVRVLEQDLKEKSRTAEQMEKELADTRGKLKESEAATAELKTLVDRQAEATFRLGGEYEKELTRMRATLGEDGEGMKALAAMKERKKELQKQADQLTEETRKQKEELESLERANASQELLLKKQKEDCARLDAVNEENLERISQNRSRLAQAKEVLQFLEEHSLDVEKTLLDTEKLLKETEEAMRTAITKKEDKAEAIRQMAGGV
ncbi:MAG: hypothetical protein LUI87_13225 [Lachnospiraceae bacterium]|nr:hypothetical protein [Lachnospiraceae bacterium]